MCVHDKLQDIRFPVPEEIRSIAAQLEEYVRTLIRERKEEEEALQREEALRLQKAREERQKRVQAFYRCLIEKGLLDEDDAKQLSSGSLNCPLCSAHQESCRACKVISCSNRDCKASSAIPIMKCRIHSSKGYCTSCLESPPAAGVLPLMGQCPICTLWFCSEELSWCIGRPDLNEGTSVIEPLSSPTTCGSGLVTRLHPTRPVSCISAACEVVSHRARRRCCNASCWSAPSMITLSVCPDCPTEDSFSCPCDRYWTCGSCESQSSSTTRLITCPRCHQSFCPLCEYILHCKLCGRVGLCYDCMEEAESIDVEHTHHDVDNIFIKCRDCEGLFCEACADHAERFRCESDALVMRGHF
ncbi:hypothetical protein K503DRAFT_764805 [Rhizopogon vinicolor AM-OR11-026]|uniref:Uncharacterized protein n=1 Tax=Rhizopogon vinicolor AM-OR11-026 TaxID=1314800 RepID=A0A1B7NI58_9AGAM|nr:hypothetical protein K503DRAFT_764805 [Rhizopogon vinicolor AM-OR11-026]